MARAKQVYALRGTYYSTVVYEYRGVEYEVEYCNSWLAFNKNPGQQHREAQARIDRMLDNPVKDEEAKKPTKSFDEQMDEIFKMLEWEV